MANLSCFFFFFLVPVSSRKAPPPVPPRTTSKPLISVTLQSSTESAQDTYLDQQDRGSEANSQSGRSNSSDSLCSIRTGSLAKGPKPLPVPPVPAPRDLPPTTSTSTQPQNDTVSICVTLEQPPTAPKRKLSSIGIQVTTRRTGKQVKSPSAVFDWFPVLHYFSGGLCSASLKRGTTPPDCTA